MDTTGSGDPIPSGGCYYSGDMDLGAATGAAGATDNFLQMFDGYHSTGDLFELVRRAGGDVNTSMEVQLQDEVSDLPMLPPQVLPEPPSEQEMAAWLYPIVRGEEFVAEQPGGNGNSAAGLVAMGDQQVSAKEPSKQPMEKVRVGATEGKCSKGTSSNSSERRKIAAGARRSNYSETHSLTEKRRRCKVNERFRTLQQLVPGCDKSNQASTLDRTIQYMKSLQQQVQSMSSVASCSMMPVAAVYPVMPPPYSIQPRGGIVAAQPSMLLPAGGEVDPTRMVPFAKPPMLLPVVHHAAVMMPAAPLIHRPPAALPNARPEVGQRRSLHSKKSRNLGHKDE